MTPTPDEQIEALTAQRDALKAQLTNLSNAAAIVHGQAPDTTAKVLLKMELNITEEMLK